MTGQTRKGTAQKRAKKWTEVEAREVLTRLEASGQTLPRFAREQGLTEQRLYWWKARLGKPDKRSRRKGSISPGLAPVVLTGVGASSAVAVVRIGAMEVEVIEPEKVCGRWLREVAEALGAVS